MCQRYAEVFQENRRQVKCCLGTLNVTYPNSEKCKIILIVGNEYVFD